MNTSIRAAMLIACLVVVAAVVRWAGTERSGSPSSRESVQRSAEAPAGNAPVGAPVAPSEQIGAPDPGLVLIDSTSSPTGEVDGPGLKGHWYSYSDGTGWVFPAQATPRYAAVRYREKSARELRGGAQSRWGAGFGFDLTAADAGSAWGSTTPPFDARDYVGIAFDAVSRQRPARVRVMFSDADTNPHAGICDPSPGSMNECFADYGADLDLPVAEWATIQMHFSQLRLPRWARAKSAEEHGFLKNKLYAIQFQLAPQSAAEPMSEFDVFVANVHFIR